MIEYLGWRDTFRFLTLISFGVLTVSFLTFDEPERGRFDIAHSVIANNSLRERSVAKRPEKHGYAMSSHASMPMEVARDPEFSDHMGQ